MSNFTDYLVTTTTMDQGPMREYRNTEFIQEWEGSTDYGGLISDVGEMAGAARNVFNYAFASTPVGTDGSGNDLYVEFNDVSIMWACSGSCWPTSRRTSRSSRPGSST